MKKILMMLTVALSVFMFSCSEDEKSSNLEDFITQCKASCEVDNCLTEYDETVDECKADCNKPTKADCLTDCQTGGGNDCEAYCTNVEACYDKMEDKCMSQAKALATCENDCLTSKTTCEEEEACTDSACEAENSAIFTCMLSIDECAAMFSDK